MSHATDSKPEAEPRGSEREQTCSASVLEVTVVFPCLNEAEAIGACVDGALQAIREAGLEGEVLVVDNNSTDDSAKIAAEHGARVVSERRRGYGSAYLRGFNEARGEFIVMLDADGTYPIEMLREFVEAMKAGADVVVGNRFSGKMSRDAMPFMNRYVGNPVLSGLTRLLYGVGLKDIHCGMRGIKRAAVPPLALRTPGMEFATEMIVKALDYGLKVKQVDIPYSPRVGESKLRPFRDAWRHVEYMLVFSPVTLFLTPGLLFYLFGVALQLALISGPRTFWFRTWNMHTNLAGLATSLTGMTLIVLGVVSCALAWSLQMRFRHSPTARWVAQRGGPWMRYVGAVFFAAGALAWATILVSWILSDLGELAALATLSFATTLASSGLELIGASFLVHIISLRR